MAEKIVIMTPEEIALAQISANDRDLDDKTVQVLAELIQLGILRAGYIPYRDHPSCGHPRGNVSMIEIRLIRPGHQLQYLKDIFGPKGWELLDNSEWSKDCIVARVAQTPHQRKEWIVEQMKKAGHKLTPWLHPDNPNLLDEAHCTNRKCQIAVRFNPTGTTTYPLGKGVWAGDFMDCPATS